MKNISAAFLVNLLYNKSMVVLTGFLPGIGMQLGLGKPWAISNEKKTKKKMPIKYGQSAQPVR